MAGVYFAHQDQPTQVFQLAESFVDVLKMLLDNGCPGPRRHQGMSGLLHGIAPNRSERVHLANNSVDTILTVGVFENDKSNEISGTIRKTHGAGLFFRKTEVIVPDEIIGNARTRSVPETAEVQNERALVVPL